MHAGRNGHPANRADGGTPEAPSAVPLTERVHTLEGKVAPVAPKEMSAADIRDAIGDHAAAARNAIRAGFDGVEIHGANSYLPHQFLADNTNRRGDAYGGSVLGRARFVIEVTEAVADAVGAERVGLRLSPGNPENGMREADPAPVYRTVLSALDPLGLAYLHLTDDPDYPALARPAPAVERGAHRQHRGTRGDDAGLGRAAAPGAGRRPGLLRTPVHRQPGPAAPDRRGHPVGADQGEELPLRVGRPRLHRLPDGAGVRGVRPVRRPFGRAATPAPA